MTATPIAVVRASLAMLPRLQAEASLTRALEISYGTGALKKDAARRVHRAWTEQAHGPSRPRPLPPHEAAGLHIAVVTTKPPRPTPEAPGDG